MTTSPTTPLAITGIDAMRGVGAVQAKGFWADAWARVLSRWTARLALVWIGIVGFFAVFAPLIANGHPLLLRELDADGNVVATSSPLFENLGPADILLLLGALVGVPLLLLPLRVPRSHRSAMLFIAFVQTGVTTVVAALVGTERWETCAVVAGASALPFLFISPIERWGGRIAQVVAVAAIVATVLWLSARPRLINFEAYAEQEAAGEARAVFTLIPWSPNQARTDLYLEPPGTLVKDAAPDDAGTPIGNRRFLLGTDAIGKDVLSQLLWACRLSISIGLVSTGLAVMIGVTVGALMGYFGGWVDLLLYRVVEVFMAIPVLFLLIVAAAVLPRNTYVMMGIIGCVTWTGAARFTRAEFMKLRNQDFVQAARALGLPLRSILFKHMLPNGVTPVLVDASFAIAAAILAEATLSYLGLGPEGQPSWGKLLSSATNTVGDFVWWLAIFPGLAIFLTVLAYNLLGEALRDAIDPKLRKAAA